MANGIEFTPLRDKKLLELAGNGATGLEMEEATGVPAGMAVLRVKDLLSINRTAYDAYERRELAMLSMLRLKAQMERGGIDEQNPKSVEAYSKLCTAIDKMSLNNEKMSDDDLNKVTEAQGRKLLQLIDTAYGYARVQFKDEYGDFVDMAVLDQAMQEGLRRASAEITVL